MTPLTEHFSLEEFLRSETAARLGRAVTIDDPAIQDNLLRWCQTIGEPLRAMLGRPIVVLSGYRPPWLNAMVGGATNSMHMFGCAADLIVPGLNVPDVALTAMRSPLPYDQVIFEFGQWTHVGIALAGVTSRHQALTATKVDGATRYEPGIVASTGGSTS
jgi:zinc D-Ala-D-Ala carboxypeptidase